MSVTAIVPAPQTGTELYRTSTDAASLCKEIVTASAMNIQGRKYVRCEGWQAIAIAHGCVASAGEVERVHDPDCPGYRAAGKVVRVDTGTVIATAEGFVGDDEGAWQKRPVYARRAMAQTRAISRACRSAFAHVVVMMNAGLETTPAEEVPAEGFEHAKPVEQSSRTSAAKAQVAATAQTLKEAKAVATRKEGGDVFTLDFGKHKGESITEIPRKYLRWLLENMQETLDDPQKAQYREKNERIIEQIEIELERDPGDE